MTTISMPGAFADYMGDTNLMTGADDWDPVSKATREALESAVRVSRGRGYSLLITAPDEVMVLISDYAWALAYSGMDCTPAEKAGARKWIERVVGD